MSAVLLRHPLLRPAADLHVERENILFGNVSPECVSIEITVRNPGEEPSQRTLALLSAAPLGAFVPWQPLGGLFDVPALDPGESHVVSFGALRPKIKPLGPPDRVPPWKLLTALGAQDDPSRQPASPAQSLADWMGSWLDATKRGTDPNTLPADPLELLGRSNPHWAGNLNIFLGKKSVERHLAQALRIYPGRANFALFMVGTGKDAYRFSLHCQHSDWETALYDITSSKSMIVDLGQPHAIKPREWIEIIHTHMMVLALCPPQRCTAGTIEVEVEQRSTQETAVVEFSLDPTAAGPGCYVVK